MLPTYRSYGATHKVGHKRKGGSPGLITKYCNRNQIEMLIKKRNHAFYAGLSGYPGKCSTMMRLVTTINMQLDCQLDRMPE